MIYCILKGGLGNMLFQIAATIEFSSKLGVDFSFPNLNQHLSYAKREQTYNPKLKCTKHYEHLFRNLKTTLPPIGIKKINFPFHYSEQQIPKDCVVEGFFQSEKYFKNSREEILNMFDLKQERDLVSIHVRRGDYLKNPNYHNVLGKEYYDKAMSHFPKDRFLIFSDDIEWCRHAFVGDRFEFYEGKNDLEEMMVMASCKHNIIANSSFSWWAAWLNQNDEKKVIAPKKWFGPIPNLVTQDIYCESWKVI
jgi:hypothetical protein